MPLLGFRARGPKFPPGQALPGAFKRPVSALREGKVTHCRCQRSPQARAKALQPFADGDSGAKRPKLSIAQLGNARKAARPQGPDLRCSLRVKAFATGDDRSPQARAKALQPFADGDSGAKRPELSIAQLGNARKAARHLVGRGEMRE